MPAYCIFDIVQVTDPAKMGEYRKRVGPTVERYGGRFLVVGGKVDVVEGAWRPAFPVIIEFPTLEQAHRWYGSEEYREPKTLRLAASKATAVFVEGR